MPKSNPEYWGKKLARNRERDKQVTNELHANGWTVIRLWEYDILHDFESTFTIILNAIGKTSIKIS